MSDINTAPSRTVTSRDKVAVSVALVLIALLAGFVYWFVTSPEPAQIKWANVGSSVGFVVSAIFVFIVVPTLLLNHFSIEAGRMKFVTWVILLLLYITLGVLSFVGVTWFYDLLSYYQTRIDVFSTCQDSGMSADECAGVVSNLGVEKDH